MNYNTDRSVIHSTQQNSRHTLNVMSLPFRSCFSVLVSDKSIGWCVLGIGAFLLAVTLQADPPANSSPTKPGKLPKDTVTRSSDLSAAKDTPTKPPAARVQVVHDTY